MAEEHVVNNEGMVANAANTSCGYLEIITGPMWSGKTSELIKLYKKYTFCGVSVLAINYLLDINEANNLRDSTNTITNHDKLNIPCESCIMLSDVCDITNGIYSHVFIQAHVILINECQFFKDIVPWVKCAVETHNKTVFICGLDGDYKRDVFGNWLSLVPFCDKITKQRSLCGSCKTREAIFTHRTSNDTQQELIGNMYIPLCRNCYTKQN